MRKTKTTKQWNSQIWKQEGFISQNQISQPLKIFYSKWIIWLQKSQLFSLQISQLRKKHQYTDSQMIVRYLTLFYPRPHPVDTWSQQQLEENVKDLSQE